MRANTRTTSDMGTAPSPGPMAGSTRANGTTASRSFGGRSNGSLFCQDLVLTEGFWPFDRTERAL